MSIRQALDTLFETLQRAARLQRRFLPTASRSTRSPKGLPAFPDTRPRKSFNTSSGGTACSDIRDVDCELFPQGIPLSVDEAVFYYRMQRDAADQVARQTGLSSSTLWSERWLPIFHDGGGNFNGPSSRQALSTMRR